MMTSGAAVLPLLAIIVLALLGGCGPPAEERPPLQPAQGSLFINGKPAEGARLVLHPVSGDPFDARGTRPTAKVGADGAFQVTTYQSGDGAPVGDYMAAILWFDDPDSNNAWDRLGNRFANPEGTGIRISIKEGENQLEPIRLDGVRVLTRPPRRNSPDFDQVDS